MQLHGGSQPYANDDHNAGKVPSREVLFQQSMWFAIRKDSDHEDHENTLASHVASNRSTWTMNRRDSSVPAGHRVRQATFSSSPSTDES